ncbi:adenylate kinase [Metamycoplasma subdolum]|uniref:Adenylate kinase n=1 Tax=Metamycoplasma subdolum TaxID=92407 RepID=A0A3M0A2C6_9BACT|nr:adenylate kinase [Metamycoplasma subdolum]RMA78594.1 adenylate kinase [Metamycoplasma subdolum]WPB50270.1 adenylate kinase [Metamycoplasma subdolum]
MINKPNLIFLGPPGAGKGTLAKMLAKEFSYFHLSTGDIFRQEIKNETDLGKQVKNLLDSGIYVPDNITNLIVKNKLIELKKENKSFILDGYPRTIDQANFLIKLKEDSIEIDKVILLNITEKQIVERLTKRRMCPNCKKIYHLVTKPSKDNIHCDNCNAVLVKRSDDNEDVVTKRIQVYSTQTEPLINYYKEKNMLYEIDAFRSAKDVFESIKKLL